MKVVIVDDEPVARRTLRECCARTTDLEVIGDYGDARTAAAAIREMRPDLLFLDIQMDVTTGLALARSLDQEDLPLIVFVTAYDHYALEAFEVSATDYLLKPFDEERFHRTLERVRRRANESGHAGRGAGLAAILSHLERSSRSASEARPRILAESGGHMHMLDIAQIELLEAERNYVKFAVARETYHVRSTLQQAEKSLQSQPMLRISRSCLVNVNHLTQVSRTPRGDFILVMAGGRTVTSSEGFRDSVRDYLLKLRIGGA